MEGKSLKRMFSKIFLLSGTNCPRDFFVHNMATVGSYTARIHTLIALNVPFIITAAEHVLRRPKLLPPFAKPSYSQAQAGAEP
jgi:hypothetical protein